MTQQQLESSLDAIAHAAAAFFHEGRMPITVSVWYSDGSCWQPSLGCEGLGQEEWEPILAQTLRGCLDRTRRDHRRPICVSIWFSDETCLQFGVHSGELSEARGADDLSLCKQDITRV